MLIPSIFYLSSYSELFRHVVTPFARLPCRLRSPSPALPTMTWSIGGRQERDKSCLGVAAAQRQNIRMGRAQNPARPPRKSRTHCGRPSILFSRLGPTYPLTRLGRGPWPSHQTSNPLLACYLEDPIFSSRQGLVEIACR